MTYIIRAKIEATDTAGMFARDWFDCAINDRSDRYETEVEAMAAAKAAYKGPDVDGTECKFWAEAA